MTVFYVLLALLLLGILIFVHEGGHFLGARWTGIPVREFAIGFGSKIKEWKSKKHETTFALRAIPAGGYCAFYGEDDPDADKSDDERLMTRFPVWKRLIMVLMGPGMNFVLALIVAIGFYAFAGEATDIAYGRAHIMSVSASSPAEEAGILPGDIITTVNGRDAVGITEDGSFVFGAAISAYDGGEPISITVLRGDKEIPLRITPRYSEELKSMAVGVSYQVEAEYIYSPVSPGRALQLGAEYCVQAGTAIITSLNNLVTTGEGLEDTGGPIRIIQLVTEETQANGAFAYISLMILISVNLGLINLLPIPGLDGSRVVFLVIEGILRRPVNRKVESYIHLGGYVLLLGLFLILTYRDIMHLF